MKKNLIVLLFTVSCSLFTASAQDQHLIDSLTNELSKHKRDTTRAIILTKLSVIYLDNNYEKSANYSNECLTLSNSIGFKKGIGNSYSILGLIAGYKGDNLVALELHKKALKIREEISDKRNIAGSNHNIGMIYFALGKYPEALKYYYTALKMNEQLGNKLWQANNLNQIGLLNRKQGNNDQALKNYSTSLKIYEELGNTNGKAASYHNIAMIYNDQGNVDKALDNYLAALKMNEESGNKMFQAYNLNSIGTIYHVKKNYPQALNYYLASLKISEEIGDKDGAASSYNNIGSVYCSEKKYKEASENLHKGLSLGNETGSLEHVKASYTALSLLDSLQGNYSKALEHYKLYITYRDSLVNTENTKKTVALQMNYDFEKKQDSTKAVQDKKDAVAQKEMQKQKLVRNGFIGGFAVVLLFAGVFFTQRNKIKKGKQRSDELLLNILPEEVAEELKAKGTADAKLFDDVTVMFTDFKNFTQISEKLSPTELVNEIHTCFKAFDTIIGKHNIEKIKTIGDSYMCAGGLPVTNKTNAEDIVKAALEIQEYMNTPRDTDALSNGEVSPSGRFRGAVRIGIHTGPVVAGIVGVKKFAYDIWGDTVNIASRMESSGEAGKVNISGSTYKLVKEKFNCKYRGEIETKGKGMMQMYFVEV